MRLAIPILNERVSPVFDTSSRLVLVEIEQGTEVSRQMVEVAEDPFPAQRARRLSDLRVNVLICGAISRPVANGISATGIVLVPWVAGPVEEVLRAYLTGRLAEPRWRMPGCGTRRRREEPRGGPRCRRGV